MNEKFDIYLELLTEFNRKINLVSSTEPETVVSKHFQDSLAISKLSQIDLNRDLKVIDIGTGGGFPGMPIIIEYPNIKLCAVDSVRKKLEFIKALSERLGVTDRVEIAAARAEELAKHPEKREKFDIALTRAVAKMNVICEYCLPFVKVGGYFIAYKAKNAGKEAREASKAIKILGGEVISIVSYTLSRGEERNLVLIRKVSPTPENYPRKPGVPAKKPL